MTLMPADEGEIVLLTKMMQAALVSDDNYILKLYQNNYTPVGTENNQTFTEATFSGYSAKTLTRANWGTPTTVSGKAQSVYNAVQSWTAGSAQTVYGYWITSANTGKVLWSELFSSSRPLGINDVLNLTPQVTLNEN